MCEELTCVYCRGGRRGKMSVVCEGFLSEVDERMKGGIEKKGKMEDGRQD